MTGSTSGLAIDAARLSLILNELRLPAMRQFWPDFAQRADKEGWPAARCPVPLSPSPTPRNRTRLLIRSSL